MNGTVTHLVPRRELTASTARQLTDAIKRDVDSLWERLLNAYEQGAHTALGYSSWAAYCKAEFGTSESHAHRLLDAGRVARAIERHSPVGESPPSERAARELVPLLRKKGEEAVAEAWAEAVNEHGPEPSAEQVEEVARTMGDPPEPQIKKKRKLTREQIQFGNNLSAMALCAEYIAGTLGGQGPGATNEDRASTQALIDVDAETLTDWQDAVRAINAASLRLRRHVGLPQKGEKS